MCLREFSTTAVAGNARVAREASHALVFSSIVVQNANAFTKAPAAKASEVS